MIPPDLNPGLPVVLIGFAEAFAAIETAWSLQDAGYRVVAFRRAGSKPAVRSVRGLMLHDVPAPEEGAAATVAAVEDLIRSIHPSVLMALDDAALWISTRLESSTVAIAGASGSAAEYALDKRLQVRAAEQAGLQVPFTQVVDDLLDANPIDKPVMVKPARALYEVKGKLERPTGVVCAHDGELRRAAARPWHPPMLIQPLVRGVGEGLFGHVGPRGVVGWSAHRRVRMVNPQGSASSACRSAPVDLGLLEPSERFLRSIDWRGMFMLEFLRDTAGQPWFMELNGRPWGSMALARRRGFEYPAWAAHAALEPGFEPTPPSAAPDLMCRNLGLDLVHLMFVVRGPQSDAVTDWPRLGATLREVFGHRPGDRLYNYDPSQPRVLLADTLATLWRYVRRAARD